MFYVYEWFIEKTNEIIYVGKGCGRRYKVTKHNRLFNEMIKRFKCSSRIIKEFETEKEAFEYEYQRVNELWEIGQCVCNINKGGCGGSVSWWTDEIREKYSEHNVMKSVAQRERMSTRNPMKNKEIAQRVNAQKRRAVIVNGVRYEGVTSAAKELNVNPTTICNWCRKGYDKMANPCRYEDEPQKEIPLIKKLHPICGKRRIVWVDNIKFETLKDAAQFLGVTSTALMIAIKNNKLYRGHVCKYDNQQPSQGKSDNSTLEGSTTNG